MVAIVAALVLAWLAWHLLAELAILGSDRQLALAGALALAGIPILLCLEPFFRTLLLLLRVKRLVSCTLTPTSLSAVLRSGRTVSVSADLVRITPGIDRAYATLPDGTVILLPSRIAWLLRYRPISFGGEPRVRPLVLLAGAGIVLLVVMLTLIVYAENGGFTAADAGRIGQLAGVLMVLVLIPLSFWWLPRRFPRLARVYHM